MTDHYDANAARPDRKDNNYILLKTLQETLLYYSVVNHVYVA